MRRVFLVTNKMPRDWQDANNGILNACASAYDTVWVIRWYAYSTGHPHWFADDRYHLSDEGQTMYHQPPRWWVEAEDGTILREGAT